MSITSSLRSLAAILFLCSCLLIPSLAHALGTQVLSNFNQPSSGVTVRIDVSDVEAIPFITDGSFTEFQGVELDTSSSTFAFRTLSRNRCILLSLICYSNGLIIPNWDHYG